jgi:hypothetical protein
VSHVELAHRPWVFSELPNELVQNQRQAIDRRDELIDCLRTEGRKLLGAEYFANLAWRESAQRQLAYQRDSAQTFDAVRRQRFGAGCHDQPKRQLLHRVG